MRHIYLLFWHILISSGLLPINITFGLYLQELMEGANVKNLVLPIVILIGWSIVYFVISIIETIFYIEKEKQKSRQENTPYKSVLRSIFFKSLENIVISMLIFCLMGICLISELSKDEHSSTGFGYLTILGTYVFFCLSAVIYKGVKIGEHFEKIEGDKDEFFNAIGAFFLLVKKWFFNRSINSFNMPENKKEKDENN